MTTGSSSSHNKSTTLPRADGKFSTEDTLVKYDFKKQNLRKTLNSAVPYLGSTSRKIINRVDKDLAIRCSSQSCLKHAKLEISKITGNKEKAILIMSYNGILSKPLK